MTQTSLEVGLLRLVADLRQTHRISQAGLATLVNSIFEGDGINIRWNRDTVAGIENGRREGLRIEEIVAICEVFEIGLMNLLYEAGMKGTQLAALSGGT